ncbi:hypothetical protein PEL8287_02728 [Roseovarius litorisediminis]|uniref:DUF3047 domain-containing protein n=1 Tax=Roseovarius litorisediminis TaxID=1312363 RepID=A0A1Y5T1T7_9RHOB|nr:DUF3047 domain-containing protein [Roseovarius litorisediminis]SLN52115.1 hypothetical protein PEL8287_02728 [Roseovarius litorisediminis]
MKRLGLVAGLVLFGAALFWMTRPAPYDTGAPLRTSEGPVHLLEGLETEVLPRGWLHRTFFRVTPTQYRMTEADGARALRCTTNNSASILARDTRIAVADLPMLSWRWKVVQPIASDVDESTEEGDDHPLRLYLRFANQDGDTRGAEIIWSNKKYAPGDFKIIGSFYHYVANGLPENIGQWHDQAVDLRRLYQDIGGTGTPVLETLGVFCDSDNTGAKSGGFIAKIVLSAADPA